MTNYYLKSLTFDLFVWPVKWRSRGRAGREASYTIRMSGDNRSCWIRRSPRSGGLWRGRRSGVWEMQVLWDQQSVDFLTRTPRDVAPLPDSYSHRNDLCAKREPSKEGYNGNVGHQPSTRHHGREFVITNGTSNFSSSRAHRGWLKYFLGDSSYSHTSFDRSKMIYVTVASDCVRCLNTPSGPNQDGMGYLIYYFRTASTAGPFQNDFTSRWLQSYIQVLVFFSVFLFFFIISFSFCFYFLFSLFSLFRRCWVLNWFSCKWAARS